MLNINNRFIQLHERVKNLNSNIHNLFQNNNDFISNLKTSLFVGPIIPIGITSIHKGNSKGNIKIINKHEKVNITFYIDDLIDDYTSELSYKFTSIDLKTQNFKSFVTLYQSNGIITIEKMEIQYSSCYNTYILLIKLKNIIKDRIFISGSFTLNSDNYHYHQVNLEPLDYSNPGNGSGCRHENSNENSNENSS